MMKIKNYNLTTNHINRLHIYSSVNSLNYEHNASPYTHTICVWVLAGNKTISGKIRVLCFCCNFLSHETGVWEGSKVNRVNINDATLYTTYPEKSFMCLRGQTKM